MKDKRDKEDEQDMQDKQDVISFLCVRHAKSHLSDKGWLWHAKWDDTDNDNDSTRNCCERDFVLHVTHTVRWFILRIMQVNLNQ